nr:reverse transcriptase domain-containing protein [Tanacetum cinerariifolium]
MRIRHAKTLTIRDEAFDETRAKTTCDYYVFASTTPENTPFAYRASTSDNPSPMISLGFIEANYEDYDEEREMKPRPMPTRETAPPLRSRSPRVRRQRERVAGFEEAPNREGSRAERNVEGSRPLEIKARENGKRGNESSPTLGSSVGKKQKWAAFPPVKGIKKEIAKSSKNQVEEKKDKGAMPTEAPILMIRQKESYTRDNVSEDIISGGKEITFPSVTRGSNSSAPVIIKAKVFGREVGRMHMDGESSCEWRDSSGNHDRRNPSRKMGTLKFVIVRGKGGHQRHISKANSHYRKTITETLQRKAARPSDMTGIPRTIMVEGKPLKTKHKLNEYNHIKPIKQKRRCLGLDHSTSACKEVEELTKAWILRKVKHQTWVANPVMVESLSGFQLKCFLDAYKDYHQIQMAEGDEDKTTFLAGEGLFCYRKMPFGLKKVGATYQRLVDKVFQDQIGRNLEAYVDDMVIKSTSGEDMFEDIKETLERAMLDGGQNYKARVLLAINAQRRRKGPLPRAPEGFKFLAIAIEHSTKWVETKTLTTIRKRHTERNSQKETPFSLTYGSEAIIPIAKNTLAKDDKKRTNEAAKKKEGKEVASIDKAYYQNKLCMYHNERSSHSTYKIGDFVLLS